MGRKTEPSRRDVLRRAAVAGALAVPAVGTLQACATAGGGSGGSEQGTKSAKNPLGVKEDAQLEVVIFNGGFGQKYAQDAEAIYKKNYPRATVKHTGTEQIQQVLQPRFVGGNPPDVVDNSGAQQMNPGTLASNGQLADFAPLLDAPSIDDPKKKVRDTLLPGTIEQGQFGSDKMFTFNYAFTVYGLWYSQSLLDKHSWKYPQTWAEMIALCAEIQKAGIAPWTYAGKFPYYAHFALYPMIAKIGGADVIKSIDNLEPNAWKHPAVKTAVSAFEELAAKKYIMPGSAGLTHIQSQTAWNQGKAVFVPNGSWVENEAKPTTPANFQMHCSPPPRFNAGDKMPFTTLWAQAGEPFIVPQQAKNINGGMEYLRIMLGKQSAQNFTKLVSSLSCVKGAADGLALQPGLKSAYDALNAAGTNTIAPRLPDWYGQLEKDHIGQATGLLLTGQLKTADWITRVQQKADATAKDPAIKKFKHT